MHRISSSCLPPLTHTRRVSYRGAKPLLGTRHISSNFRQMKIGFVDATRLRSVLLHHSHERVGVLGAPCSGKSTLVGWIEGALDMDDVLFPQLSAGEKDFVFQKPWTPAVGLEMTRLARQRLTVQAGAPVFATVLLDVDFIVHLQVSDELLRRRIMRTVRPQPFALCKGIQEQLNSHILESGIPRIDFELSEENHGR